MLNTTSAYSVSPKGLLDLSTGRQKDELTIQKGRKFWGHSLYPEHSVQTRDEILNMRPT